MPIHYVEGDATLPVPTQGPKIIAHICNDIGAWGAGFVVPLGQQYPLAKASYQMWFQVGRESGDFRLGETQVVEVASDLFVANMLAQRGISRGLYGIPLQYAALKNCLIQLRDAAITRGAAVHMPRIGCGLAGGSWDNVGPLVDQQLSQKGITVFVYDPPVPHPKVP